MDICCTLSDTGTFVGFFSSCSQYSPGPEQGLWKQAGVCSKAQGLPLDELEIAKEEVEAMEDLELSSSLSQVMA